MYFVVIAVMVVALVAMVVVVLVVFMVLAFKKILHTGDIESLDRCGQ